ncbi:flagellar basal body P-ring formation chaperone FlgA [Solimicrobium silvestre]|uniref:Flagella basal body P-ring formation protein FlgA n=1 Tax=Solimicrobium silvestre TaxID=2099400 RepID=A0A2S9H1N9_9BURK|nr:flagellar basal body P-ring formation chaperone FlgA [Solimicrobium silvestre]PRC93904.1 Flagella basal body P-ring formation protein FlgA [Solimicrobium silvestre]
MKTVCTFLTLLLISVSVCCHAQQTGAVHAVLQAEVLVDGRVITLGDVARLSGASPAALDTLRGVQLATAPQPGYSSHLTQREVLRLLHEAGIQELVVEGADATTVMTVAIPFDPEPLVAVAKTSLAGSLRRDGLSLELTHSETLPVIRLPRGEVTLRPRQASVDRPRSHMVAWVDILLDGSFYRSVPVSFSVSALQQVLVTRSSLNKGQVLSCDNVELEQRDIAQLAANPQVGDCSNLKRRLRRNLSTGEVLLSGELEAIPAVSEGDIVTLEVTKGAVVLESHALALTDGQVGQRISVRATLSQEPVLAMVIAPGIVNVSER